MAGAPLQTPLKRGGPCPRLAKSLEGAAGVPVRQWRSGGTGPGAGAGPRESGIVRWCRQPGGCSQPGANRRDSPNHTGLWRGPPSLREGEDKAACTHTHTHTCTLFPTLLHPSSGLASRPLCHGNPCPAAPFTAPAITGDRRGPCPCPRSALPAHAPASPPPAGKQQSQRDCDPTSLKR